MTLPYIANAGRLSRRTLLASTALFAGFIASDRFRLGATSAFAQSDLSAFLDGSEIHDIHALYAEADYQAMIAAFEETADKEWILATMTIGGTSFDDVGMRLKGNSSLMALRGAGPDGPATDIRNGAGTPVAGAFPMPEGTPVAGEFPVQGNGAAFAGPQGGVFGAGGGMAELSADEPEGLPWLVRLDREIDDQSLNGMTEFVVRGNNSLTALNEAVALELLAAAGLASQRAAYARFSVSEREPRLRLVIENPNDDWMAAHFSEDGMLFKAEATGNWSYRGDDPASYDEVFDLEAGGSDDDASNFAPLTAFLDFINNSDDESFASELPGRLDIDGFATYLAMMNLIGNTDDIDGPGNNAYLYYNQAAEQFTVVPWDMNLSFQGGFFGGPGGPDGPGAAGPGQQEDGQQRPAMPEGGAGGPVGGRGPMSNPLVERFLALPEWTALVESTENRLRSELYTSGLAAEILARWGNLLETQASDLVSAETIATESAAIAELFTSE